MTFPAAVNRTAAIRDHLKGGLRALKKADGSRVSCSGGLLRGSVDLDHALRNLAPNEARWDYAIGVKKTRQQDAVVWLEVHPASSLHVDEMLDKLRWLRQWLGTSAPALERLPRRFCWVSTGTVSFGRGSPQAKKVALAGLRHPVKHA